MRRGQRGAVQAASAQPPDVDIDTGPVRFDANVDLMSGDALRRHAQRIGVFPRDVDGLSEDRLRQNCKAFVSHYFELLHED